MTTLLKGGIISYHFLGGFFMGKCMLCGKETEGQVCEKCQKDYELKLKEIEENEQKYLDILAEKRDTSGLEYLLHVLAFLCIFSVIFLSTMG